MVHGGCMKYEKDQKQRKYSTALYSTFVKGKGKEKKSEESEWVRAGHVHGGNSLYNIIMVTSSDAAPLLQSQ